MVFGNLIREPSVLFHSSFIPTTVEVVGALVLVVIGQIDDHAEDTTAPIIARDTIAAAGIADGSACAIASKAILTPV